MLTSVERSLGAAGRGVSYYERALARVENRWAGSGHQGERFRNANHLYADDLDVFGRGSLFELLCNQPHRGRRALSLPDGCSLPAIARM